MDEPSLSEIAGDLHRLRADVDELRGVREDVADVKRSVATLSALVLSRLDGIEQGVERPTRLDLKTIVQFASLVLVPICVALIGAYVALKGAASK